MVLLLDALFVHWLRIDHQKYTYSLAVVVAYGILQHLAREVAVAAGLIGQTLPTDTRIVGLTIALNAK